MTTIGKQKRLTLADNHDLVQLLDKGDHDSLSTLCIMLKFTDMLLHSLFAKIYVLVRDANNLVFLLSFFLTIFRANGVSRKPDVYCIL